MISLVLSLVLAQGGFFFERLGAHGMLGKVVGGGADKVVTFKVTGASSDADEDTSDEFDDEGETQLEVVPPVRPVPTVPPVPPIPPRIHIANKHFRMDIDPGATDGALPRFSETGKNVPTAEVLHRIAQRAGWSMTLVGAPKDKIDIDVKDVDPREALREVLKKSGAMGVLKSDKLVVVASPESGSAGLLIEQTGLHAPRLHTHGPGGR